LWQEGQLAHRKLLAVRQVTKNLLLVLKFSFKNVKFAYKNVKFEAKKSYFGKIHGQN